MTERSELVEGRRYKGFWIPHLIFSRKAEKRQGSGSQRTSLPQPEPANHVVFLLSGGILPTHPIHPIHPSTHPPVPPPNPLVIRLSIHPLTDLLLLRIARHQTRAGFWDTAGASVSHNSREQHSHRCSQITQIDICVDPLDIEVNKTERQRSLLAWIFHSRRGTDNKGENRMNEQDHFTQW